MRIKIWLIIRGVFLQPHFCKSPFNSEELQDVQNTCLHVQESLLTASFPDLSICCIWALSEQGVIDTGV